MVCKQLARLFLISAVLFVSHQNAFADATTQPQTKPSTQAATQPSVKDHLSMIDSDFHQAVDQSHQRLQGDVDGIAQKKSTADKAAVAKLADELKQSEKSETQKQNLDAAEEIHALLTALESDPSNLPATDKAKSVLPLRTKYDQTIAANAAAAGRDQKTARNNRKKEIEKARQDAQAKLHTLLNQETSQGNLENALLVRDQIKAIDAFKDTDIETLASSNPTTQNKDEAKGQEILDKMVGAFEKQDGFDFIDKHDRMMSAQVYAPPVQFKIVAQTDSTDLRIGYIAQQIIFNWGSNPSQLRIDGGPAGGRHQDGQGQIPVNQWVTIDIIVKPNLMIVRVDGQERLHTEADFSQETDRLNISTWLTTAKVKSIQVSVPEN